MSDEPILLTDKEALLLAIIESETDAPVPDFALDALRATAAGMAVGDGMAQGLQHADEVWAIEAEYRVLTPDAPHGTEQP